MAREKVDHEFKAGGVSADLCHFNPPSPRSSTCLLPRSAHPSNEAGEEKKSGEQYGGRTKAEWLELIDCGNPCIHEWGDRAPEPSDFRALISAAFSPRLVELEGALREAVRLYECYGLVAGIVEGEPMAAGKWINAARAALSGRR